MPATTQLASLVVSAFDTFLIVDNSCLSAELFNVIRKPFSYCSRRYNHFLHMGPRPTPPGTHLHVAAARKRSHQWCVSLTPNNTNTVGRMTRHCFLRPIRRDLRAAPTLLTHLETLGAIHSTKISGNFGPKLNGSVRSNRKSFEKTGPPFEVDHFSRSDRLEFWLNGSCPLGTLTPPIYPNIPSRSLS